MKKILMLLSLSLILAQPVRATLITFDDLTAAEVNNSNGQIPQGYGGLGWLNFYWGQSSGNGLAGSWGQSGFTSGPHPFTLNGAYLIGPSLNYEIEVYGSGMDGVRYDNIYTLSAQPTWIDFNYVEINSVIFAAPGQIGNPMGSVGLHFSMDYLVINESAVAIPEPATYLAGALLVLPLAIGVFQRMRKAT